MEKYSQYRDRGSGIAPFFPVPSQPSGIYLPLHISLFLFRLPILLTILVSYFTFLHLLPIGSLGKKAALWLVLGIPGIWWIDLQIDGVRKGSLATSAASRLPHPSTIIASSYTSPIDALYLAAIFDPIFTASYPTTRLTHRITLLSAILRAFAPPQLTPPPGTKLVPLSSLLERHPNRAIVVFPESTTTNGRGILTFTHTLLSTPPKVKIFPISLRYTPQDITTPVPGTYLRFLWNLLSKPTHCIRVRIAERVYNTSNDTSSSSDTLLGYEESGDGTTPAEKLVLDKVGESLARLGRVKRVGLGVKEKLDFINTWTKQRRRQ